jgi:hypothetical protein
LEHAGVLGRVQAFAARGRAVVRFAPSLGTLVRLMEPRR